MKFENSQTAKALKMKSALTLFDAERRRDGATATELGAINEMIALPLISLARLYDIMKPEPKQLEQVLGPDENVGSIPTPNRAIVR